ncbi:MAG: 30S ribosomal protein S6 [Elusimicrobiota bacterium]
MATYETLLLVDPSLSEEEVGKYVSRVSKLAAGYKAKIVKEEKLGRRRLAYPVNKKKEGSYVCLQLEMPTSEMVGFERDLKLEPQVMRSLTIRLS